MTDYRERAREKAYNAIVGFFSDEWCREYAALRPDLEEYLTTAISSAMEEAERVGLKRAAAECAAYADGMSSGKLTQYQTGKVSGAAQCEIRLRSLIKDGEDVTARPRLHQPGTSDRDWTEDFTHENGNYVSECSGCGKAFWGHKRRRVCRECDVTAQTRDGADIYTDKHAIRELTARPAGGLSPDGEAQDGWQPMDTAPLDGTLIEAALRVRVLRRDENVLEWETQRHIIAYDDCEEDVSNDTECGWSWEDYEIWRHVAPLPDEFSARPTGEAGE